MSIVEDYYGTCYITKYVHYYIRDCDNCVVLDFG